MIIEWRGLLPSDALVKQTHTEVKQLLADGLACAEDLITHTVMADDGKPRVAVWGEKGKVSFQAEWTPDDYWATFDGEKLE